MTVTIDFRDPDGKLIGWIELFDDVYQRMNLEAALIGVDVREHVIETIAGHAQHIIDSIEEDT